MPTTDPATAAAWNTAAQLGTTAINSMAQTNINKKTMQYNDDWAYRQREWAMQDYKMQNEYNTPLNQRKRMIEAGMNPALMYGSSATTTPSATVRGGNTPNWSPKAPEVNFSASNSIMTFLGVRMQEAQLKNMEIQNRLLEEKITNTSAQTQLTWDKSKLTNSQNEKLQIWLTGVKEFESQGLGLNNSGYQMGYQSSMMEADLKLKQNAYVQSLNENERRDVYTAANALQIAERIAASKIGRAKTQQEIINLRENLEIMKKSGILQQFKINGEEFLNGKFSDPAAKGFLLLLQKALE